MYISYRLVWCCTSNKVVNAIAVPALRADMYHEIAVLILKVALVHDSMLLGTNIQTVSALDCSECVTCCHSMRHVIASKSEPQSLSTNSLA